LKFLSEVNENEIKEIKKRLSKINFPKFKTSINGLGVFFEEFVRIVWLYLSNCDNLQKKLMKN